MSSGRPTLVFVGAATLDAIALVDSFPEPDQRVIAQDIMYTGGGPAATAAVTAARLGVPAAFVGTVGDDADGQRIREGLSSEGVDVSSVSVIADQASGASVVVVDRARGTRAICTRPGPPVDLSLAGSLLGAADWVHTDHFGWAALCSSRSGANMVHSRLSVDAGNAIRGFSPAGVDLFVPTIEALRATYGELEDEALLDAALAEGARCVVATDGPRGSLAACATGERFAVEGLTTKVLSTLGAGDVFHGALLAAHVRGMTLQNCLAYANVTAALSCLGLGGRSAIPTHDVVMSHLPALIG
jgi:sugar/nucleoside kinase (ribokinase family)